MDYQEKKISDGIASRIKKLEQNRNETQYLHELRDKFDRKKIDEKHKRDMYLKKSDKPSDKPSIRLNHSEYIKSYFDIVGDEKELREIHEENMKLAIDNFINGNPVEEDKKEEVTQQFSEELDQDFDALLAMYRIHNRDSSSEHKKALEIAKKLYATEMDKHFKDTNFLIANELEALHEEYKCLSMDKLREDSPSNRINPRISEQLNHSIDIIYDKFKRENILKIPNNTAIGIDLGTTYCCVGVINRGKVEIISNTYGFNTTPSYISFLENGEELVGISAKDDSWRSPANTIFDVKRMIGRKYNDEHIQNDKKLWPFEVVDENESLKVKLRSDDNITLYPEEISAKILSRLKRDAEGFLGFEPKSAVITVPAYFNDAQRQATKDAGTLAGLNVLQILNEPTAAAIAYSHKFKDDFRKNVLIYDLGGGTFDVAVVVIENGDIDVRAVGGDTHLGGNDFDQRILSFLFRKFEDNFRKSTSEDNIKRALARLRINVEKKKWIISEVNAVDIDIDVLLPGWDFKYHLTRSKFEDLCIDLFKKTIQITDETLKCSKIKASDINEIVLIGGSTKIPKIQSLLKEYFADKPLNKQMKPDEAVAIGATIQAALLNGEKLIDSNQAIIHDVLPFSLGIEVLDKSMAVIIPRNTKIPTQKSQTFYTAKDDQTYVYIQIFEGENKTANQNRLLGVFVIDGLPKRAAGLEKVEVTLQIDNEGILHIKGVASSGSANLTVKDHRGRISADKLKMLINKAKNAKI